jgi:hypothetical protein
MLGPVMCMWPRETIEILLEIHAADSKRGK